MCYDENMQKGFALIYVLVGVLILVAVVGGVFIYTNYSNNQNKSLQKQAVVSQTSQPSPTTTLLPTLTSQASFQPTSSPIPSLTSSPTSNSRTYVVPSNWKKWIFPEGDFSFYLPSDWVAEGGMLYYFRDAGYKPESGTFGKVAYLGGSKRSQYIQQFNDYNECEPQLTNNTSVTEETINGLSILLIVPIDPSIPCHVTPAFVFVKNNFLYQLEMNNYEFKGGKYWNSPGYLNIFLKILASIKY